MADLSQKCPRGVGCQPETLIRGLHAGGESPGDPTPPVRGGHALKMNEEARSTRTK